MKLRTSFFNKTLNRKNISRFAPVWAVYTIILLLYFTTVSGLGTDYRVSLNASHMTKAMSVVNLLYAGILASFLFGDLFNSRHCNMLHAFPLRRETIFGTNIVTALVCSILPNALVAILAVPFLGAGWLVSPYWFAAVTLQFVFFLSTALLSVMLSGNRLGFLAVYVLVNFWSMLLWWFASTLFMDLLFGVMIRVEPFWHLCPVVYFCEVELIRVKSIDVFLSDSDRYFNTEYGEFQVLTGGEWGWPYLFLCAAIAVGLTYLALVLYRKRKLECAGDFIAIKVAEPVVLVLFTLGVGAFFQLFSQMFGYGSQYIFLAVGLLVGFFACLMLLQKTTRVFTLRAFRNFAIFVLCLAVILLGVWLDPLGITRTIPDSDEIVSVEIGRGYGSTDILWDNITLDTPEDIETIREVHQYAVDNRYYDPEGASIREVAIGMNYTLDNGRTFYRYYQIPMGTPAADALRPILSRIECVSQGMTREEFLSIEDSIHQIYINDRYFKMTDDAYRDLDLGGLLDAILADCASGAMVQYEQYHYYDYDESAEIHWDGDTWLELSYTTDEGVGTYLGLAIFNDCVNTTNWLIENRLW